MSDFPFQENAYGIVKRFEFILHQIEKVTEGAMKPLQVADIGCGTGALLSLPVAKEFRTSITVVAHDEDFKSLKKLLKQSEALGLSNISVSPEPSTLRLASFDVVIASEVLEHVKDPRGFLEWLNSLLKPGGYLILTLPNGYGWFEFDSTLYRLFQISGINDFLDRTRDRIRKFRTRSSPQESKEGGSDTLALSLHENFFSYRQLRLLLEATGFDMVHSDGRTFACGDITARWMRRLGGNWIYSINNRLGSKLPRALVSGWMFMAQRVAESSPGESIRLGGLYTRFKRWLNQKAAYRVRDQRLLPK